MTLQLIIIMCIHLSVYFYVTNHRKVTTNAYESVGCYTQSIFTRRPALSIELTWDHNLETPINQNQNLKNNSVKLRSHLVISFNQNQNLRIARSTWNLIWWFPLTNAKIFNAIGYTWDLIWRSPLTRTKILCAARSTWNPICNSL
jgi:hypothetical protein